VTADSPQRLGALLAAALRQCGRDFDPQRWQELGQAWREAAGEPLATHAVALRYERGQLVLGVDAPVWAARLRHGHGELIGRLRRHERFRDLRTLQVRVLPRALPAAPSPAGRARRPSATVQAQLEAIAEAYDSDTLRAALARLRRDG
jgi:hypothetical protein